MGRARSRYRKNTISKIGCAIDRLFGVRFYKKAIESSVTHQLEYEKLTADEIKDRWPGITIPDDYYGCLDPNAGFLFSEECIRTYKEEAEKLGAVLKEYEPATEIIRMRNEVKVITGKEQYSANHLIITAGAWTHKLVKNINLPITIIRKTIGWFEPMKKGMYDHHFPCFVFKTESDGNYYGFPNFNGSGVKLGRMDEGHLSDPDKLNREFGSFENDEGDLRRFLEKYMSNASGTMLNGKVCMFSMTPNEDFIVDRDPEFDNIIIAGGFSGRGFKFASVIGSILSDLVVEGETTHDISSFQIKRFMEQQA